MSTPRAERTSTTRRRSQPAGWGCISWRPTWGQAGACCNGSWTIPRPAAPRSWPRRPGSGGPIVVDPRLEVGVARLHVGALVFVSRRHGAEAEDRPLVIVQGVIDRL